MTTAQQLITAFDALPDAEQESVLRELMRRRGNHLTDAEVDELAGELFQGGAPAEVPAPSPELLAEIHRRLAALDADPSSGRTWEQVMERINRGQA